MLFVREAGSAWVLFRRFEYPTLPLIAPGRSVVSQSITTARWGDSMPRAQVTAWSERRSQGGAVVVIIGRPPEDVGAVLMGVRVSTALTRSGYAP
jgi:hypothetical protein